MDVFEIDLVMELLELLELDFVLLGKVLEDMIPGLSGSKGGEGEPSLSELSSTEFLLILKLILPALVVFFSMYFGTLFDCLRVFLGLQSASSLVISSESSSSIVLFRFFRSSLVAFP